MADTVKARTVNQTVHKSIFVFSSASDGTGESNVTKIDISTLPGAPSKVKITKLEFSVEGMSLEIKFNRTSGGDVAILNGSGCIKEEIEDKGAGLTGDIVFNTLNAAAGAGYTVLLEIQAA